MAAARKFLFDRTFDVDEPEPQAAAEGGEEKEPAEPEPPPPPTFSEEELAQARDEAFQQGREQGVREAAEGLDKAILETLEAVGTQLGRILNAHERAENDAVADSVRVATAVARKLFPDLAEKNALGEIERVAAEAMSLVLGNATLTVRVNRTLVEPLKARLETLKHRVSFRGNVALEGRDDIAAGDCRIDWENGGAARDTAAIWRAIDTVLIKNEVDPPAEPANAAESVGPESAPATAGAVPATTAPEAPDPAPGGESPEMRHRDETVT